MAHKLLPPGPYHGVQLFPVADGSRRRERRFSLSRPGCGNHLAIGPVDQGGLVWWSHSKGDGPTIDLTQGQPGTPREVLRGERPKRFFPPFLIGEKWGPAERPHRGRWFLLRKLEKKIVLNLSSKTAKKYGQHLLTVLFYGFKFSGGSACAPPRQCSAAARWRPERPRTPAA